MKRMRFFVAAILGIVSTAAFGFSASLLATLALSSLAQKVPNWWGEFVLATCFEGCMGKTYVHPANGEPQPFDGFTLVIVNHGMTEDYPGIIGIVSRLGLSPALVSKEENLQGWVGLIAGRPLERTGRGAFIAQKGGKVSRERLIDAMKMTDELLIFPDKHRPSKDALKKDRQAYPDTGLESLCMPRAGGVHSILEGALAQGRRVRVIDVTWHVTGTRICPAWEDVTCQLVERASDGTQRAINESDMRTVLLELWRKKEAYFKANSA